MTNARADLLARQDETIAQAIEAEIEENNSFMGAAAVAMQLFLDSLQTDINKRNAALQAKADAVRAGTVTLPPAASLEVSVGLPAPWAEAALSYEEILAGAVARLETRQEPHPVEMAA